MTLSPAAPPPSQPIVPRPAVAPKPQSSSPGAKKQPSRLSVARSGSFSFGLRLGFPELTKLKAPGASLSPLIQGLQRAKIAKQILSGKVPTSWELVDKEQLAAAIWGIFSTHIAPGIASNLTGKLAGSAGSAKSKTELDVVLITDFSSSIGGGLSFTLRF